MTTEAQPMTWADIQTAVDEGRITLAQGQQAWGERVAQVAAEHATKAQEAQAQVAAVGAEIERYTAVMPAVATEGTPEHSRVKAEFTRLRKLGFPDALQTELAALQAVFGRPEALSKKHDVEPEPQPQEEVGGAAPGKKTPVPEGAPASFSSDEKRFYDDLIRKGVIKSWAAAAELMDKHGSKRVRAKHA